MSFNPNKTETESKTSQDVMYLTGKAGVIVVAVFLFTFFVLGHVV